MGNHGEHSPCGGTTNDVLRIDRQVQATFL
jgi:hypothetical protein